MEWISSEGGPLILIEKELIQNWKGINSSNDPYFRSDYEHACSVDDYIGSIKIGNVTGLVLGDEPCQTSYLKISDKELLIIRWQWADSEEDVLYQINHLDKDAFDINADTMEIRINNKKLIIFDAALSSEDKINGLEFELIPGKYQISTLCYVPNKQTSLILHKFLFLSR